METRKIIGTLLLALAAVVCLASNVWFIIKMPAGGDKTELLLLHSLPEVIILAVMAYTFAHPGLQRSKPTIDILHRRIKRKTNRSIDPDGYRYVSFGAMSLFIVIAFTVDLMHTLGQSPFSRIDSATATLVLILLCMGFAIWGEIKVRLANPNM